MDAVPDAVYIHGTAESEQGRLVALNRLTNQSFVDFLELKRNHSVLEVGRGLGMLAAEVAVRAPHGEVVGVEYSAEQLAATKVTQSNLRFQQGDALRCRLKPIASTWFTAVTSSNTSPARRKRWRKCTACFAEMAKSSFRRTTFWPMNFTPTARSSTLFGENSPDFNDSSAATL